MIHEYALEPELVATWYDHHLYRYFIERFFGFEKDTGDATGRVVAQYPSDMWQNLVWDAFEKNFGSTATTLDWQRMEELLKQLLKEPTVRRPCPPCIWDYEQTWLENAEEENRRHPFQAIFALDDPRNHRNVVRADDFLNMSASAVWRIPNSIVVDRTADSMAKSLKPMLRCATRIFFIDPHFRASEPRYQNPLREFLNIICHGRRQVTLEYHTMYNKKKPSWDHFFRECKQYLPCLIPRGFTLTIRRWRDKKVSENLHNRYILTDIGGVQFGVGLDEYDPDSTSNAPPTDDIYRMGRQNYQKRCKDYGYDNSKPAFKQEKKPPIVIRGRRNIR